MTEEKMEVVLKNLCMDRYIPSFIREKISPDIVNKLSAYEMRCLGVGRSDMVKLRTECIKYGSHRPDGGKEFQIPKVTIECLLEANFKISDIAKMLSVSESTIYRRMKQYNLSKCNFADIDSEKLDMFVKASVAEFPHCGEVMLKQILFQQGIKVPRADIRDCLHQLDESAIKERTRGRLHRRVYHVEGPNHLWHVDTNHKLIRWHFVIAGGIDGFSRLITFLKCTDNNKAITVFKSFLSGKQEYGVPLKVRSDKGMENSLIADYIIRTRGHGSMITGKSTHNQRIERLWRDVYEGVLSYYYDLFHFIEDEGILDIMNDVHIFALHHVFLSKINEKLEIWKNAWAMHRIRTVGSSPLRLFTAGIINTPVERPTIAIDYDDVEGNLQFELEENNPRPIFITPTVSINAFVQNQLDVQCPKNWKSPNFGVDIFVKAVAILEDHLTNT